jgi:hypothetical protein
MKGNPGKGCDHQQQARDPQQIPDGLVHLWSLSEEFSS